MDSLFKDYEGYLSQLSYTDILAFVAHLTKENICIRQPLYKNLIYPVLSKQVEHNNLAAIKVLLRLDAHLQSYQNYTKDTQYPSWILLEKALILAPNDQEILGITESKTYRHLSHTLHELPTGVLYGMDGATIEECEELILEVDRYEKICNQLNKLDTDRLNLIQECKYYFPAYRNYLSVFKNYVNFGDYLEKECKPYTPIP